MQLLLQLALDAAFGELRLLNLKFLILTLVLDYFIYQAKATKNALLVLMLALISTLKIG